MLTNNPSDFPIYFSALCFFCFGSHKPLLTNLLAASLLTRGMSMFLSLICFARAIAFFSRSFSDLIRYFTGSTPEINDLIRANGNSHKVRSTSLIPSARKYIQNKLLRLYDSNKLYLIFSALESLSYNDESSSNSIMSRILKAAPLNCCSLLIMFTSCESSSKSAFMLSLRSD